MKVNILLSAYNGQNFIAEQIKSIQKQTFADWNLLVRDDGSTDITCEIVEGFIKYDNRIQLVKGENLGVIQSFFELVKMDTADFYFFCDQDDIWLTEKIELELLEASKHDNSKPVLYYSDLKVVDKYLKILSESMITTQSGHANTALVQELTENTVTGCTSLMNHELSKLWNSTEGIVMHDWYLALLATAMGELIFIDQPTVLYRQHDNNVLGARTFSKRIRGWSSNWLMKYWELISLCQNQAQRLLSYEAINLDNRELIEKFVNITDETLFKRSEILKKYNLRKNRMIHTIVFKTLLITKFAYKTYQKKGYKK